MLFLITGESFRHGPQCSRIRGGIESFNLQKLASQSHIHFFEFIQKKYRISVKVVLISYKINDEYDTELVNWYKPYLLKYELFSRISDSETEFIERCLSVINNIQIEQYNHLLLIRIDFFLKKYFFEIFKLSDKLIYVHPDYKKVLYNCDLVCHNIMLIPKKYYNYFLNKFIWIPHDSLNIMIDIIGNNNIDFFIYTPHWLSTDLGWNPIYSQVGRKELLEYNLIKDIITLKQTNNNLDFELLNKYENIYFDNYKNILFTDTLVENIKLLPNNSPIV